MPTQKFLPILHELCGNNTLSQIFLVTTMWDEVDEQDGRKRLTELKDKHWNGVVNRGSTHRHSNTPKSAKDILQKILEESAKRYRGLPPQLKSPDLIEDHELKEINDTLSQVKTIRIPLLVRILALLRRRFSVRLQFFFLLFELTRKQSSTSGWSPPVQSSGSSGQLGSISSVGATPGVEQERVSGNILRESSDFSGRALCQMHRLFLLCQLLISIPTLQWRSKRRLAVVFTRSHLVPSLRIGTSRLRLINCRIPVALRTQQR